LQLRWQWLRPECQPEEFSRHFGFPPLRVLSPDSLLGQFARKETHIKRYQQTLFS